ncbi:hypothetical protein NUW58_g3473 [Xylaria curta]|uniref:Uncharacterized protein n=1 Tax=Xylaria curta TaxID=42375 RepID=A0ACC1PCA8_9PEZI|nr:hypothetical protein NUW58_g3473 [Xylaria curta]
MRGLATVAYVAFAFLVIISLAATRFIYSLFRLRSGYSARICNRNLKIYYYALAATFLLSYFTVAVAFLALITTHGSMWAEWSWRWSVGGALLDSICAIKSTREWSKTPQIIYFQTLLASIETVLIIIGPAFSNPAVGTYVNLGAIICHSLWTFFVNLVMDMWTAADDPANSKRWPRCQRRGIHLEPAGLRYRKCFHPLRSGSWRADSEGAESEPSAKTQRTYNILFFGKGPDRTKSLRKVLQWPPPSKQAGGIDIYFHPTLKDTQLASVPPGISLSAQDKESYMHGLIKSAAAVVLVFDLFSEESFEYVKTFQEFSQKQPILLVACNNHKDDWKARAAHAGNFASQHKWDFAIISELETAFENLSLDIAQRQKDPSKSVPQGNQRDDMGSKERPISTTAALPTPRPSIPRCGQDSIGASALTAAFHSSQPSKIGSSTAADRGAAWVAAPDDTPSEGNSSQSSSLKRALSNCSYSHQDDCAIVEDEDFSPPSSPEPIVFTRSSPKLKPSASLILMYARMRAIDERMRLLADCGSEKSNTKCNDNSGDTLELLLPHQRASYQPGNGVLASSTQGYTTTHHPREVYVPEIENEQDIIWGYIADDGYYSRGW